MFAWKFTLETWNYFNLTVEDENRCFDVSLCVLALIKQRIITCLIQGKHTEGWHWLVKWNRKRNCIEWSWTYTLEMRQHLKSFLINHLSRIWLLNLENFIILYPSRLLYVTKKPRNAGPEIMIVANHHLLLCNDSPENVSVVWNEWIASLLQLFTFTERTRFV